ncbi:hypothetical protein JTE90_026990 [Oedothorax gibbosus]|uniref:Uncharacterized protein n=1 Tax=Oedothorax gibbosus TaxID=931172 RepID=A0AAV6TTW5_9ARAC|nr:hypothetical protein JTE90_026990 [Oedothorax gibbosus]
MFSLLISGIAVVVLVVCLWRRSRRAEVLRVLFHRRIRNTRSQMMSNPDYYKDTGENTLCLCTSQLNHYTAADILPG